MKLQHMRGRQDCIRGRGFQRDLAIAIAVHPALQNVGGQHLHLPDLTRPCPLGAGRVQIAARRQLDGRKDLRLKQLGAAAIMAQRQQRVAGVEIALHLTKIRLECPERQNDPARGAVFLRRRLERGVVFLGIAGRARNATLTDQTLRKLKESLAENALGTVRLDHRRIALRARQKGFGRPGGQTLGGRLGGNGAQKPGEIAATGGRQGRAGHQAKHQGNFQGNRGQTHGTLRLNFAPAIAQSRQFG